MSLSKYFNPIPDASVTFDGATVQLEESLGAVQNDEESASEFKNVGHLEISDITFRANEGEVVLVLGKTQHQRLQRSIPWSQASEILRLKGPLDSKTMSTNSLLPNAPIRSFIITNKIFTSRNLTVGANH
ncbi:CFF_HP2_G0007190.mRNA.1.CDS.1 [Saccharomyces cerevisiae]|nr:CFF_HP2_G0007190.mRNA.1.CDS.1 [Saccharomyces cerevisiae]CAI6405323.1 CFF_HP2_G0007190.mRNA.1.CDS.1 [Saccharomyces cerevisiae]